MNNLLQYASLAEQILAAVLTDTQAFVAGSPVTSPPVTIDVLGQKLTLTLTAKKAS